mmetsp:Transcript_50030/g.145463  ORF Transcript_50030/g.145463 Transcript_50030/m.145463 type:complete len:90 (+) Transcript_50030:85-354(+)
MMLRNAARLAVASGRRQGAMVAARPPTAQRAFGAVAKVSPQESAVARPFKGASRSEPNLEYIEEPSMLYMTCLVATPWIISFWFLTKFV